MNDILCVDSLTLGYGNANVVHDVSFDLKAGEIVAVLGSNGAGKSTLARGLAGLIPSRTGRIVLDGTAITDAPAPQRVGMGMSLVPEGRALFPGLTVRDNLLLGAYRTKTESSYLQEVLELMPPLTNRLKQEARTLSGGEQQMLAIGRALMARPKVLILDEPSLGLAPVILGSILRTITSLASQGTSVLLIEQNARAALDVANRGLVLERGRIILSDDADSLRDSPAVIEAYLGSAK